MNRDKTLSDLAAAIVEELMDRDLLAKHPDGASLYGKPIEAVRHVLDMEMPNTSLVLYEAYRKDTLLMPLLISAMHYGIDKSFAERDAVLEKQLRDQERTRHMYLVAPELTHRLIGDAKALLDDVYS